MTRPSHIPRTAIVTGAASGIGRATVAAFLAEGWIVAGLDRDRAALDRLLADFADHAGALRVDAVDVTDTADVARAVGAIARDAAPIRAVVTSAGIGANLDFFSTTADLMRRTYEVNVIGTFQVVQQAALAMRETGGGSIVTIGSVSGVVGNLGRTAYGASKGAIVNLTRIMAVELARYGIRVNCVAPGPIETAMSREFHTETVRRQWDDTVPAKRYGTPEEVASAVLYLADDARSAYVQGQILAVDGGFLSAGLTDRDWSGPPA